MTGANRVRFLRARAGLGALAATAWLAGFTAPRGTAETLIVSNTSASGPGSLQQAILDANATNGLDWIIFQIPGSGVHTIAPTNNLPPITDSMVMDGTTQPGFAGTPLIQINGANAGVTSDGLRLPAGSSTIRGLVISGYGGAGIHVQAPGGTNNIEGNFIGTDPTGTLSRGNGQSSSQAGGVWIDGSSGNLVGGSFATNRNLISGNSGPGLFLQNCTGNTVQGNLIGTTLSGAAALRNSSSGIGLFNASTNQIGGTSAALRNIISGNGGSGVHLNSAGSKGNLVQGNYIGTDSSGTLALPNAGDGVTTQNAGGNRIGATDDGAGNLLSGNTQGGVGLKGFGSDNNLVQGNYIGTDASGRFALGNALSGITIFGGNSNLVGGTSAASRNIVSANKLSGVFITTNSTGNLVQGNFIGVDITGMKALGNVVDGVSINSAGSNLVGGTTAGARNIISGNTNYGIEIFNTGATGNLIQGNYIGPAVTGQSALGNKYSGVYVRSSGNIIGGTASGAGNLISGNNPNGVFLVGASASENLVQGNYIGTTAAGTGAMANAVAGIGLSDAPGNTIGGASPGAGNVISGNNAHGIYLIGAGTTRNAIQGNKIGTDVTGTAGLGNGTIGIYLDRAVTNTIGGIGPAAGNLISANRNWGIFMTNNASWNSLQGNLIGTAADGVSDLGNGRDITGFHAVELHLGCRDNIIGGASPGAGNVIAFAPVLTGIYYAGIRMRDGATNNLISGNSIFANGGLGIDLGAYLVTPNDDCDTDSGANMLQNFPVLTEAVSGNGIGVRGVLNSRPHQAFLLQFFANPACDPLGYGEGQTYLGQQTVITGDSCSTSFVASLPGSVPAGYAITATATDTANNTSEFSACVPAALVPALSVSPAAGQQIALAWTNATTSFVLKETGSLSPPIHWTTVTNSPVPINGQLVLNLPAAAGNQFFLLSFE